MGRPTDPIPSVTLQVLREISARRDSRPDLAVPAVPADDASDAAPDAPPEPHDDAPPLPSPPPPRR